MLKHWTMVVACLWMAMATLACQADAQGVITTLKVTDITGVDRKGSPVRGGVPLTQGQVRDPHRLRLVDQRHQPMPADFRAIARWPDGSVKWLLIDTLADVPANGSASLTLMRADAAASGSPLAIQTDQWIEIPLPGAKLRVPLSPSQLGNGAMWDMQVAAPDDQWRSLPASADSVLQLQSVPPGPPDEEGSWLRDAADDPGQFFKASLDTQRTARLEENDAHHAIVRIDGWHVLPAGRRVFPYTLRIIARRGSPSLQMSFTFTVTEDPASNFLRSLTITIPGVDGAKQASAGLPQGLSHEMALTPAIGELAIRNIAPGLRHYDRVSYKQANPVDATLAWRDKAGLHEKPVGQDAPGWLLLTGESGASAVGFRDFARMHPKELSADAQGNLHVHLWPQRGGKTLDLRRRSTEIRREFNENGADPFGGRGVALTHEWFVTYQASPADAHAIAIGASQPLRPMADPRYIASTLAFGEFQPAGEPGFEKIDQALAFAVRYLRKLRQAYELDGMIDWGDLPIAGVGAVNHLGKSDPEGIPFRGYNGWLNNDWGLAHGLFLHAIRTGDPRALLDAENMTRHVMDVDTIHHYPEQPSFVGQGRRHDQQHWGNGPRDYCFAPYATVDHYLLTGEGRAYDMARFMADHPIGYGRYATIRFWELSGDDAYLKKAQAYLSADLRGNADGWPFALGQNFRSNSYDGIGYTFYDSIAPNEPLTRAIARSLEIKARAWSTVWMDPGHPTHLLAAMAHRINPSPENTQALKSMVWAVSQGKINLPDVDFNLPEDADFEQYVKVNRQSLNIGRTDVFGLYYLIGLPRVMARLASAGVDERACFNLDWQWEDIPSFTEKLDSGRIRMVGQGRPGFDHEYDYLTDHASPGYRPDPRYGEAIGKQWLAAVGRTRLYEDGVLLGPSTWPRAQMREHGLIGWTRRLSGAIAFTTPDNSDPRTNGRTYTLTYTSAADEKWQDVPSFTETFPAGRIMPFGPTGHVWAYRLTHAIPQRPSVEPPRPQDEQAFADSLKRHAFLIDGQPQGDIHPQENWATFWKARVQGWGRCESLILFVLPAEVDPRTDGRAYSFRYVSEQDAAVQSQTQEHR